MAPLPCKYTGASGPRPPLASLVHWEASLPACAYICTYAPTFAVPSPAARPRAFGARRGVAGVLDARFPRCSRRPGCPVREGCARKPGGPHYCVDRLTIMMAFAHVLTVRHSPSKTESAAVGHLNMWYSADLPATCAPKRLRARRRSPPHALARASPQRYPNVHTQEGI